jgi:hypothetical protein
MQAHDISGHGYDPSVRPPETLIPIWFDGKTNKPASTTNSTNQSTGNPPPAIASIFSSFFPWVATCWDDRYLYIQSRGMPEHGMMVGITNWQQQIPVPQDYFEANSWRLPLNPIPSQSPVSIKGRFLRGAIASAAN